MSVLVSALAKAKKWEEPLEVGSRVGGLLLLEKLPQVLLSNGRVSAKWRCICDCGKQVEHTVGRITAGRVKTCGCQCFTTKRVIDDLTSPGKVFGKLTVLEQVSTLNIVVQCSCGTIKSVRRGSLLEGDTKTCGCGMKDPKSWTDREKDFRLRYIFGKISKRIKIRDDFTCALCSIRGGPLHVHHIESWVKNPRLRFDTMNLITLCKPCHIVKAHDNALRRAPNLEIAKTLKQYVINRYGGVMEKNGTLYFTQEEEERILSGEIPERISRDWGDLTLYDLTEIVNKSRNTKGDN